MKTFKHKTNGSTMTFKDGCMKIENLVIEGTPNLDYWEEVVEKDWEILTISTGKYFLTLRENGKFVESSHKGRGVFLASDLLSNNKKFLIKQYPNEFSDQDDRFDYQIFSAKNLKTGEIFSVGDYFTSSGRKEKVEGIIINDGQCFLQTDLTRPGYGSYIMFAKKFIEPLFVSEDGVDIFDGDRTYAVRLDFTLSKNLIFNGTSRNLKYFAEKENAEEYILMNKPSLSLNDIIGLENSNRDVKEFQNSPMAQRLINFVKSTL